MGYELTPYASIPLTEGLLEYLLEEHESVRLPQLLRMWHYYRNALAEPDGSGGSADAPAQSSGLPARLKPNGDPAEDDRVRKELVIENDIAWRVHTLVDFMFPSAPRLLSQAADPDLRERIERVLDAVLTGSGGIGLWQDAAMLCSVYGSVDFLVSFPGLGGAGASRLRAAAREGEVAERSGEAPSKPTAGDLASRIAECVAIETVEAPRAVALLSRQDYRRLDAHILHYLQPVNELERPTMFDRLRRGVLGRGVTTMQRASVTVTEIRSAGYMQRYEDGVLVDEAPNRLGRLPVVHIQNLSQPFVYDGLSDVEPLIPLQDELNTRLSDRANRVTMQSFRMWLGKGIEGFTDQPIGPGQMWLTDNLEASIEGFGGDADSPSERAHLEELREALDKASGVTPAAAGHIKARVGNLTSENALRISLMGTLAKTKRKRVTFGAGIEALCELILHGLSMHGVFHTSPEDRRVEVVWQDPLPPDETRRINDALAKAQLGVPLRVLRAELGYGDGEE